MSPARLYSLVFFIGMCFSVLLIVLVWGIYEHGADTKYAICVTEKAAYDCEQTGEGLEEIYLKQSVYLCDGVDEFGLKTLPRQLNETEIYGCWNASGSLLNQLN